MTNPVCPIRGSTSIDKHNLTGIEPGAGAAIAIDNEVEEMTDVEKSNEAFA